MILHLLFCHFPLFKVRCPSRICWGWPGSVGILLRNSLKLESQTSYLLYFCFVKDLLGTANSHLTLEELFTLGSYISMTVIHFLSISHLILIFCYLLWYCHCYILVLLSGSLSFSFSFLFSVSHFIFSQQKRATGDVTQPPVQLSIYIYIYFFWETFFINKSSWNAWDIVFSLQI